MRGQWLIVGCCALCLCWLPSYSRLFFLLGALLYYHIRCSRGIGLFLLVCVLFLVRIPWQEKNKNTVPTETIVQIQEIKSRYVIAKEGHTRVILYGLEKVNVNDVLELRGTYEMIESIHNPSSFSFAQWAARKGITYAMNVKRATLIEEGHGLRHALYAYIESMDQEKSSFVKMMLYGIHEDEVSYLLISCGMHLSFLLRKITTWLSRHIKKTQAEKLTLIVVLMISHVSVLTPSILRLICFQLIRILFPKTNAKDQLGMGMIVCLLWEPSMAYEAALLLPICFRIAYLFNVTKQKPWIISFLVLFPFQMWWYHSCDPLQVFLFAFLRHWYACFYVLAWLMLIPQLSFLYALIRGMLWLNAQLESLTYPLYGSVNVIWLLFWIRGGIRLLSDRIRFPSLPLAVLFIVFFLLPYLSPFASVTMLDVGQGDCTLIVLPYQRGVYLIDVMGHKKKNIPKEIIVPYLRAQGIRSIDTVIVTHHDLDHSGGVQQLQELMPVKQVIDTKQAAKQLQHEQMKFLLLDYAGADENDNSIVTMLRLYDTNFLFMGDLGIRGEQELLRQYPALEADVLKVGHHGSKTSSSVSFLHQVQPSLALISCGRHNFYGHPHEEVLSILEKEGTLPLITSRHGGTMIKICKYFRFFKTAEQQFGIIPDR